MPGKDYSKLPVIGVEIAGKRWFIIDPAAVLADRERLSRSFFLPCQRCDFICTDVGPCKCCQIESGRPYDDRQPAHGRIPEADVLKAIQAYADAHRVRRAS